MVLDAKKVLAILDGAKADLINGKVPSDQLPSYVDDVVEYANRSAFPATGEAGKIYVALDTNKTYRWSGTTYIEVGGGSAPVTSVNSKTGAVVLDGSDINVDDTATTPQTIKAALNQQSSQIDDLEDDLLPRPSETPIVGQLARVKTVNSDGTFTTEWVDDWVTQYEITTTEETTALIPLTRFGKNCETKILFKFPAASATGNIVVRFYQLSGTQVDSITLNDFITTSELTFIVEYLKVVPGYMQLSYRILKNNEDTVYKPAYNFPGIASIKADSSITAPIGTKIILLTKGV